MLGQHDIVQPDVLFISNARASIIDGVVNGAPDLVIEVLSPSNHDYDEHVKFKVYERTGVLEYWIVDPDAESVKIFRGTGNKFAAVPLTDVLTSSPPPQFLTSCPRPLHVMCYEAPSC